METALLMFATRLESM